MVRPCSRPRLVANSAFSAPHSSHWDLLVGELRAPRGFGNALPAYAYEWEDLIAQQEQGELEATQPEQNRVRLQPSYRQVTDMRGGDFLADLSRRSRAGLASIQSCRLGLRMRARRDVRGVPVRRKRRDASGTLHQRLRPGRRQAARRSSTRILASARCHLPSIRNDDALMRVGRRAPARPRWCDQIPTPAENQLYPYSEHSCAHRYSHDLGKFFGD
jgi:hypothetical protein